MDRLPLRRRLRRLRAMLGLVAALTAVLIAVACRFESIARGIAATGALVCLVAWVTLLEAEGRTVDQLERRRGDRPGRPPRSSWSRTRRQVSADAARKRA